MGKGGSVELKVESGRCAMDELGHGVTMTMATDNDAVLLHANIRADDLREAKVYGNVGVCGFIMESIMDSERRYAIWHNGNLVGILWTHPIANNVFTNTWAFLTTRYVERIRKTFVRMTPEIIKYIWAREPKHVNQAVLVIDSRYERSINWALRVIGARRSGVQFINGVEHVLATIDRKEF